MARNVLTTRLGAQRSRLLIVAVVVVLALAQPSFSAQPDSTPQTGQPPSPGEPAASPSPGPDPDRTPSATGDPDDDRQIGISLDDLGTGQFRNLHRIDDPQRVLEIEQRVNLADDAQRLTNHGLPTIIVVRESAEIHAQAQTSADRLRVERGVESTEGADDGMVMLATINPDFPRSGSVVLSFGQNALPKGGLTAASAQDVYDRSILPRVKRGNLYSALHVGIRRIIYLETYIPEAPPPLTESEQTLRAIVNVVGPLALVGSAAGFMLGGHTPARSRTSKRVGVSPFARTASIVGIGAVLLFVTAVVATSTIGVASAALMALLVWTQLLIGRLGGGPSQAKIRSLSLPSRRTFTPARRAAALRRPPSRAKTG